MGSPHRTVTLFTCHLVAGPDQDGAHVSVEEKCETRAEKFHSLRSE